MREILPGRLVMIRAQPAGSTAVFRSHAARLLCYDYSCSKPKLFDAIIRPAYNTAKSDPVYLESVSQTLTKLSWVLGFGGGCCTLVGKWIGQIALYLDSLHNVVRELSLKETLCHLNGNFILFRKTKVSSLP
jgi:hypothetical protein